MGNNFAELEDKVVAHGCMLKEQMDKQTDRLPIHRLSVQYNPVNEYNAMFINEYNTVFEKQRFCLSS